MLVLNYVMNSEFIFTVSAISKYSFQCSQSLSQAKQAINHALLSCNLPTMQ